MSYHNKDCANCNHHWLTHGTGRDGGKCIHCNKIGKECTKFVYPSRSKTTKI